jgi:hypothetical protein
MHAEAVIHFSREMSSVSRCATAAESIRRLAATSMTAGEAKCISAAVAAEGQVCASVRAVGRGNRAWGNLSWRLHWNSLLRLLRAAAEWSIMNCLL